MWDDTPGNLSDPGASSRNDGQRALLPNPTARQFASDCASSSNPALFVRARVSMDMPGRASDLGGLVSIVIVKAMAASANAAVSVRTFFMHASRQADAFGVKKSRRDACLILDYCRVNTVNFKKSEKSRLALKKNYVLQINARANDCPDDGIFSFIMVGGSVKQRRAQAGLSAQFAERGPRQPSVRDWQPVYLRGVVRRPHLEFRASRISSSRRVATAPARPAPARRCRDRNARSLPGTVRPWRSDCP